MENKQLPCCTPGSLLHSPRPPSPVGDTVKKLVSPTTKLSACLAQTLPLSLIMLWPSQTLRNAALLGNSPSDSQTKTGNMCLESLPQPKVPSLQRQSGGNTALSVLLTVLTSGEKQSARYTLRGSRETQYLKRLLVSQSTPGSDFKLYFKGP